MDLGIKGRRALVCASSKGLGHACAAALAAEGVHVTMTARGAEALAKAAAELRRLYPDVEIIEVAGDITTPEGRAAALAACPNPDILINNAGGPPPGDFRNWGRDDWIKALDANMLTPIELIKATVDGMVERHFGRIVNITSAAVKAPIDVLGLSNGARTGLTGFVAGLARKTVRHNVTINALLPGPFDTDRLRSVAAAQAKAAGVPVQQILRTRMAENPAGRFGDPAEFGQACAFLCGAKAGYITGQNLLRHGKRDRPNLSGMGPLRSLTCLVCSGLRHRRHHDPNQIGGVLGAELLHDVGAMILNGPRADTELPAGFLVGVARRKQLQHLALAHGERLAPREIQGRHFERRACSAAPRKRFDRLLDPGDDLRAAERLFDEIKRAILDGVHRHRNVAFA